MNKNNPKKNIILIGCGLHSRKTYLPFFEQKNITPILIVDTEAQKNNVTEFLGVQNFQADSLYFVSTERKDNELIEKDRLWLDKFAKSNQVDGVIISTDPSSHKIYLDWALRNKIDVLCEKPLTCYENVNYDLLTSKQIYKDIQYYSKSFSRQGNRITLQCQRRYHPAYAFIYQYLEKFIAEFKTPINYINISSSNGLFNFPHEYLTKKNHPHNYGYGKVMHSGYHFIDLFGWFASLNRLVVTEPYSEVECFSSITTAHDLQKHLSAQTFYRSIVNNIKHKGLKSGTKLGEIDSYNMIQLKKGRNAVLTGIIALNQNTVSKRDHYKFIEETFKKDSAIRKERMTIELGPLLSIEVMAYQESQKDNQDLVFKVVIHRNSKIAGGQPLEVLDFSSSVEESGFLSLNQLARAACFEDFVNNKSSKSDISSHIFSTELLSIVLQNIVAINVGKLPFYKKKLITRYAEK